MKILLAEDEEHIAKLVSFKLTREGFEVTCARNGKEAIEAFFAQPWSLIILDVMMPVFDGWEVLKKVRATPQIASVPVLMLTAKGMREDVFNAVDLGATRYLKKPFDPANLASVVRSLIGGGPWDSDPELKALRDEFIESFDERRKVLLTVVSGLKAPQSVSAASESLRFVAHKLAGVAETHGFASLTQVCGALDDLLESEQDPAELLKYVGLLDAMLAAASKDRRDPISFVSDPVFKELICAAE